MAGCTADLKGGGQCGMRTNLAGVPAAFQYFGTSTSGGLWSITDFCPFYIHYNNQRCEEDVFQPETRGSTNWRAETFETGMPQKIPIYVVYPLRLLKQLGGFLPRCVTVATQG